MAEGKERLDVLLVQRGLAASREKAKELILAGAVYVNGTVEKKKAGVLVAEDAELRVEAEEMRYVSRGGYKLEKALENQPIELEGKTCADLGASTGGFTDCMLQHGAKRVYAVDVGTDQLAEKLRADARVVSMEKCNVRYLDVEQLGEQVDFASVDVSFISLTLILPAAARILKESGELVCLIKPQFEAGRELVGKKGVVKEKSTHRQVIANVLKCAETEGFEILWLNYSPIKGPEGNIEYLLHAKKVTNGAIVDMSGKIKDIVETAHKELDRK